MSVKSGSTDDKEKAQTETGSKRSSDRREDDTKNSRDKRSPPHNVSKGQTSTHSRDSDRDRRDNRDRRSSRSSRSQRDEKSSDRYTSKRKRSRSSERDPLRRSVSKQQKTDDGRSKSTTEKHTNRSPKHKQTSKSAEEERPFADDFSESDISKMEEELAKALNNSDEESGLYIDIASSEDENEFEDNKEILMESADVFEIISDSEDSSVKSNINKKEPFDEPIESESKVIVSVDVEVNSGVSDDTNQKSRDSTIKENSESKNSSFKGASKALETKNISKSNKTQAKQSDKIKNNELSKTAKKIDRPSMALSPVVVLEKMSIISPKHDKISPKKVTQQEDNTKEISFNEISTAKDVKTCESMSTSWKIKENLLVDRGDCKIDNTQKEDEDAESTGSVDMDSFILAELGEDFVTVDDLEGKTVSPEKMVTDIGLQSDNKHKSDIADPSKSKGVRKSNTSATKSQLTSRSGRMTTSAKNKERKSPVSQKGRKRKMEEIKESVASKGKQKETLNITTVSVSIDNFAKSSSDTLAKADERSLLENENGSTLTCIVENVQKESNNELKSQTLDNLTDHTNADLILVEVKKENVELESQSDKSQIETSKAKEETNDLSLESEENLIDQNKEEVSGATKEGDFIMDELDFVVTDELDDSDETVTEHCQQQESVDASEESNSLCATVKMNTDNTVSSEGNSVPLLVQKEELEKQEKMSEGPDHCILPDDDKSICLEKSPVVETKIEKEPTSAEKIMTKVENVIDTSLSREIDKDQPSEVTQGVTEKSASPADSDKSRFIDLNDFVEVVDNQEEVESEPLTVETVEEKMDKSTDAVPCHVDKPGDQLATDDKLEGDTKNEIQANQPDGATKHEIQTNQPDGANKEQLDASNEELPDIGDNLVTVDTVGASDEEPESDLEDMFLGGDFVTVDDADEDKQGTDKTGSQSNVGQTAKSKATVRSDRCKGSSRENYKGSSPRSSRSHDSRSRSGIRDRSDRKVCSLFILVNCKELFKIA